MYLLRKSFTINARLISGATENGSVYVDSVDWHDISHAAARPYGPFTTRQTSQLHNQVYRPLFYGLHGRRVNVNWKYHWWRFVWCINYMYVGLINIDAQSHSLWLWLTSLNIDFWLFFYNYCSFNLWFFLASAMLKQVTAGRPSFRPSVRLSVTRWYCIKTAEHIVMLSSPQDSPFILVLCVYWIFAKFRRGHPLRGR